MQDVTARTGLFGDSPSAFLEALRSSRCSRYNIDVPKVEELLAARARARQEKDFAGSDALRDQLKAMHVEVRDTPKGQVWDLDTAHQ